MAKVKVYSRLPQPLKFTFKGYVGQGASTTVEEEDDSKTVILNGCNEVVNHTLIVKEGAVTIFGYSEHDLSERKYTLEDLERLKKDSLFKKFLKNGDVSLDTLEDLSRDFTGVGKLSDKELKERMAKQNHADGEGLVIHQHR